MIYRPDSFRTLRRAYNALTQVMQNPAIRVGLFYAVGGIGFALGTLLLAKALPPSDFASTVLIIAITQVTMHIGPLGADVLIIRYPVNAEYRLLGRVVLSSGLIALIVSGVSARLYELSEPVLIQLFLLCTLSSINVGGSAFLRGRQRFLPALILVVGHNVLLPLIAVFFLATGSGTARSALWLIASGYVLSSAAGWWIALRAPPVISSMRLVDLPWREGSTIMGTSLAVILLIQIERLLIPNLLGQSALALFSVLGALAASPFRILQMAVGYTMIPRLRAAQTPKAQRQLLVSEAKLVFLLTMAASSIILAVTRPLVNWLFESQYQISYSLIGAALFAGFAKIASAFGAAGVTALGRQGDLLRLSGLSWLALACAGFTGVLGSTFGLTGLMLGVAIGWGFYAAASFYSLRIVLRQNKLIS